MPRSLREGQSPESTRKTVTGTSLRLIFNTGNPFLLSPNTKGSFYSSTLKNSMNTEKNNVDLSFRSYNDNHDTDLNVNINGEHVDDEKLKKLLNTWLVAIGSELIAA
jgi:hypothetical protein